MARERDLQGIVDHLGRISVALQHLSPTDLRMMVHGWNQYTEYLFANGALPAIAKDDNGQVKVANEGNIRQFVKGAIDNLQCVIAERAQQVGRTYGAPKFANATRFYESKWQAYTYLLGILDDVALFCAAEMKNHPGSKAHSIKELAELLNNPAKRKEIDAQLQAYCNAFRPLALLLEHFVEVSKDLESSQLLRVAAKVTEMIEALALDATAHPSEVTRHLAKALHHDATTAGGFWHKESPTRRFYEAAQWLDPGFAFAHVQLPDNRCDPENIGRILNCPFADVYHIYVDALPTTSPEDLEKPVAFWKGLRKISAEQRAHMLDCLLMPVAVTTCDSVFSVEGALFSPQQVRLDREKAATLLQIRANGDLENLLPHWARVGFHGNSTALE